MSFDGWPEEALEFYEGLEADNTKTYWVAHKQTYDKCVLAPMTELLDELGPEYGEGRIFRPHRDLRFSKDKSPYKTAIAAVIGDGYLHLSAHGLGVGSGMHVMAPDQLERYRRAVAADHAGSALEELVAVIRKRDIEVQGHEVLKSAPRGYPADHPRADLLRCKGLVAWRDWPVESWLGTAAVKDKITEFLTVTAPLTEWLAQNVGESAMAAR